MSVWCLLRKLAIVPDDSQMALEIVKIFLGLSLNCSHREQSLWSVISLHTMLNEIWLLRYVRLSLDCLFCDTFQSLFSFFKIFPEPKNDATHFVLFIAYPCTCIQYMHPYPYSPDYFWVVRYCVEWCEWCWLVNITIAPLSGQICEILAHKSQEVGLNKHEQWDRLLFPVSSSASCTLYTSWHPLRSSRVSDYSVLWFSGCVDLMRKHFCHTEISQSPISSEATASCCTTTEFTGDGMETVNPSRSSICLHSFWRHLQETKQSKHVKQTGDMVWKLCVRSLRDQTARGVIIITD